MILLLVSLYWILHIYMYFIILNILLSWVPALHDYGFIRVFRRISDWYIEPFRGGVIVGSLDFTPIIGIFIYTFITNSILFLITIV